MKIVNVNAEYSKQDTSDASLEIRENQPLAYFNWPLYCEVQPGNNAQLMTEHVLAAMDDESKVDTLTSDELSYYQSAQNYLAAEKEGKKQIQQIILSICPESYPCPV